MSADVRALPFMPLFVGRLLASDTWLLATGDEAKAAVTLWARAWQQVPAGTLPNDDRILAALSGAGAKWRKVRAVALRGFDVGDDGRLHHALIEEAAADALARMRGQQTRTVAARAARQAKRHALRDNVCHRPPDRPPDIPHDRPPDSIQREREREREREQNTVPTVAALPTEPQGGLPAPLAPPGRAARKPRTTRHAKPGGDGKGTPVWHGYADAYFARYGVEPVRNAKANALCAQLVDRLGGDDAPHVAAWFVRSNRGLYVAAKHALDLLIRDAEGLRTEWATGNGVTDTQARQADRTAATANVFATLRTEVRDGTTG